MRPIEHAAAIGEQTQSPTTLEGFIAAEVDGELADPVVRFVEEIRGRHGETVASVLFYGSCLRDVAATEGVLDFYAIVDSYSAAYMKRSLAWTNALLPPNVYYVELETRVGTLRAKYNVMSARDFARAAQGGGIGAIVWGRFSQPFRVCYARDDDARAAAIAAGADAVRTMIATSRALARQRGGAGTSARELWTLGLAETYGTELRTEGPDRVAALYEAGAPRYEEAARLAALELDAAGADAPVSERRWQRRKRVAKAVYLIRLLKSAWTFGDWLPYALWKYERHTGKHIEITEAQRRHPFLLGWPVMLRVLNDRDLR